MPDSLNATLPLEVLRDRLIPTLFQENQAEITYWAGKSLALTETFSSETEIMDFFSAAGFGQLEVVKTATTHSEWRLSGDIIDARIINATEASFSLEAGFLAQALETLFDRPVEVTSELSRKKDSVTLQALIGAANDDLI